MNAHITDKIDETIARLREVGNVIDKTPAFARWRLTGSFELWLVQLFPITAFHGEGPYPIEERQADAKAIARALGGKWTRRSDGSWETDGKPTGGLVRTILHQVDCDKPEVVTNEIDLTAP
jgi:hypothetical protein